MRIVYNNRIPFKGFTAVNLFGVLFVRKGCKIDERVLNHERIHTAQMKEMLYIGFYIWYFFEWLLELFHYGTTAYHTNTFEREAHLNDENLSYLDNRERFAWVKYI